MGLFDNLFIKTAPQLRETTGVVTTTDPNAAENQQPKSASWETAILRPTGRTSLLVPAWYRGVSLIMQTMGQMVIQYQRISEKGGNFVEDRGYLDRRRSTPTIGNRLNWLLQVRPNPLMTASQMQEQIEYRKIYYGNAFVYIERDEYDWPKYLWLCTSGSYNPVTDRYSIVYNGMTGGKVKFETPSHNVLHFKNVFLTDDYYMGIPTLDYAVKALSIAATADEQALQDVAKGGRHKVLLQEEKQPVIGTRGRVNPTELKKMTQQFSEDWAAGDVVLLSNVADAKIISQTSQQLQLLEQRSFQVADLARILGVPRMMMMDDAGGGYKMPEHATQEFMLRTIQPRIREHEDEFNSKILGERDFGLRRIHVCAQPLRRLDAKGQAEIDDIRMKTGWSLDEIRSQYDLPSIKGGEIHYISTNLAEVGSEKLRTHEGQKPQQEKGGNDESENSDA